MHRLNELAAKLTPTQVKQLEDFAEFLVSRQRPPVTIVRNGQEYPSPAAIAAAADLLSGLPPDKASVELQHEALAARANKD
ncbi:MAG TPA: hypothetical protein VER17_02740 [Tepidisphaeraceae bacterium]|nr:hypothetical protein [Tepidisphaeraceae bacterium]